MTEQRPQINQVDIIAGDLRRSIDFYGRLVSLPTPAEPPGASTTSVARRRAGWPSISDTAGFAQFWNKGWAGREDLVGRVVLGFGLATREAVDAKYDELTSASYSALAASYDAFWGARYAIVEDPNGIAVGLMSPIDLGRRVWPIKGWPS
jgi:predicted enzyme related to lactoylglutathione lyase